MKVAIKAAEGRYWKYQPAGDYSGIELVFFPLDAPDAQVMEEAPDAQVLVIDAIAAASAELIAGLPQLRAILSEGVGYNGVDVAAATERGIFVCNNAGINATAVAEQVILLMLGLLRSVMAGQQAVLSGQQIQMKEHLMLAGIRELADCQVGLIGMGAIGRATAKLLQPFGCPVFYYSRTRMSAQDEAAYGVQWMERADLIRQCDIVSLHCPVTPETTGMVDAGFLAAMKPDALLINTARGDLVDNDALAAALQAGTIGGAGIDTLSPEPVLLDNPLLNMSQEATAKVLFSPHLAGVTTSTFKRGFANTWGNFVHLRDGERPLNIVNGL